MKFFVVFIVLVICCPLFGMHPIKFSRTQLEKLQLSSSDGEDNKLGKQLFLDDLDDTEYNPNDVVAINLEDGLKFDDCIEDIPETSKKNCCAHFLEKLGSCLRYCKPRWAHYRANVK